MTNNNPRNTTQSYVTIAATAAAIFSGLALSACTTPEGRHKPFTQEWRDRVRNEEAFQRRKARIEGKGDLVLMGDPEQTRAAIRTDEKGRPRLNIGGPGRISADLDYSGGPEGEVEYKHEWDFSKPAHRGRQ